MKKFFISFSITLLSTTTFLFIFSNRVYAKEYSDIASAKQVLIEQPNDFEASRYLFHNLEISEYLTFMESLDKSNSKVSFNKSKYQVYNFENNPEVYFILIDTFEDFDYISSRNCRNYNEGSCRFGRDYMIQFIDGKYIFSADISNAFSEYSNTCNKVFDFQNNTLITYSTDMCGSNAHDTFHRYRYYDLGKLDANKQPQYLYTKQKYTPYTFFIPVGFIFLFMPIFFIPFIMTKTFVEILNGRFRIKSLKLRLLILLLLIILASTSWWLPQLINIRRYEKVSPSCYWFCGG